MDILYKTINGRAVNAGTYVVSGAGLQLAQAVPELDAEVGVTLTKETLDYMSEPSVTTHNHKPVAPAPAPVVEPPAPVVETPVKP